MNDHSNVTEPVKEVADLNRFDQGPLCGGQMDNILKSTVQEINLGPMYYAYHDLKLYKNLSSTASLLRDMKDSGLQICVFYILYDKNNSRGGENMRDLLYLETNLRTSLRRYWEGDDDILKKTTKINEIKITLGIRLKNARTIMKSFHHGGHGTNIVIPLTRHRKKTKAMHR